MPYFDSPQPSSSPSGSGSSGGSSRAIAIEHIPRTGSGVFRMVRTSTLGYRIKEYLRGSDQHTRQNVPFNPTNNDLGRASSHPNHGSNLGQGGSATDTASAMSKPSSGKFTLSIEPVTPKKRAKATLTGKPQPTSPQSPPRWMPAGKSAALPLASPQSAKRTHSGATDVVGALLGKHPSAAESDAFEFDDVVELVFRKRLGNGNQGTTYVGHLTKSRDYEDGLLVFVKQMDKKFCLVNNRHSEVRANERLLSAAAEPHPHESFVTRIHAFVDPPPPLKEYVFVYELHHFDLTYILEQPFEESLGFDVANNCPLWITQITAAIEYLHSIGIIHRDIKPENVLVDGQLNMRLTDLGAAFVSKSQMALDENSLYGYLACGSPLFMAPEMVAHSILAKAHQVQWKYDDPDEIECRHVFYGPKVDWFSFGLLVYEMVSTFYQKRRSKKLFEFTSRDREALLHAWYATVNGEGVLVSAATWNGFMQMRRIPTELWELLWSLLHSDPSQRGDSRAVIDNPFFIRAGQRIYDILAHLSFDSQSRPYRVTPQEHLGMDYLQTVAPLRISHTQSTFHNRATKSWIDTNSCFFAALYEPEDIENEGDEEYDDGDDDFYYYD